MKDLDPKSLIIGFLAAVLVTVAMGNALADKWDVNQQWEVTTSPTKLKRIGWEPFHVDHVANKMWWRKRIK